MKIKEKNNKLSVSATAQNHIIGERLFPKPICLEKCDISVVRGYENDVFETLKSFSNETDYNRKKPHDVTSLRHYIPTEFKKMKECKSNEILSLDLKKRHDKYRLLYCFDKERQVYKILTLCTDKTHD